MKSSWKPWWSQYESQNEAKLKATMKPRWKPWIKKHREKRKTALSSSSKIVLNCARWALKMVLCSCPFKLHQKSFFTISNSNILTLLSTTKPNGFQPFKQFSLTDGSIINWPLGSGSVFLISWSGWNIKILTIFSKIQRNLEKSFNI